MNGAGNEPEGRGLRNRPDSGWPELATGVRPRRDALNACNDDPQFDFDMASYSQVKSYGNRLGDVATDYPVGPEHAEYPALPGHQIHAV